MKLTLKKQGVDRTDLGSYSMTLEIVSAEDIKKACFVKQRLKTINNGINDVFVAVCTPAQLEDLPETVPDPDTSYFRTSKIELIAYTLEYLKEIEDAIVDELNKLIRDCAALVGEKEQYSLILSGGYPDMETPLPEPIPQTVYFMLGENFRINTLTGQMQSRNYTTGLWHNMIIDGNPPQMTLEITGVP